VLVLAGGTQGERYSTLRRLAAGSHQHLTLEPEDMVVHSARTIPGNERAVVDLFCELLRRGVALHTRFTDPGVHASGHAGRSEQRQMIEWINPRAFIPLHGTLHHLQRHAALAREVGVPDVLVVENGTPVVVDAKAPLSRSEPVAHGSVNVAFGGVALDQETANRRIELGRGGVATVAIAVDEASRLSGAPVVQNRGVPGVDGVEASLSRVRSSVERALGGWRGDHAELESVVHRSLRRAIFELSGVNPTNLVHVVVV
jgi:ribonuclease J